MEIIKCCSDGLYNKKNFIKTDGKIENPIKIQHIGMSEFIEVKESTYVICDGLGGKTLFTNRKDDELEKMYQSLVQKEEIEDFIKLQAIKQRYEDILNMKMSMKDKNISLANLMNELEIEFHIPIFKDCERYRKIPEEIKKLYEEISMSRNFEEKEV